MFPIVLHSLSLMKHYPEATLQALISAAHTEYPWKTCLLAALLLAALKPESSSDTHLCRRGCVKV